MTGVKDNMDTMKNSIDDHDQLIKALAEQLVQIAERVERSVQTPPGNTDSSAKVAQNQEDEVKMCLL